MQKVREREETSVSDGVLGSMRRLADASLQLAQSRLQLLQLELQEEKQWLVDLLILSLTTVALGLLALMAITFMIVVLFWQTGRVPAIITLAALYVIGTIVAYLKLRLHLKNAKQPLEDSIEEFKKDRAWVNKED